MSGHLPKTPENFHHIPNAKLAIIASMWHPEFVDSMVERAKAELHLIGVKEENLGIYKVPGSLELPYAAGQLFEEQPELDAILAFGVVLEGDTTHNDSVIQNVVHGFTLICDRFGKPVINEVIGVKNISDAAVRSADDLNNKGVEAVFAVSELLRFRDSVTSTEVLKLEL
jgi:6,7-dimethyl-8-ribityllumazine synthase